MLTAHRESSSVYWHSNLVSSSDWLSMLAHIFTTAQAVYHAAADILPMSFHCINLTRKLRDSPFAVPPPRRSTELSTPIVRQVCASQQEPSTESTHPVSLHACRSAVGSLQEERACCQVSQPSSRDLERWLRQSRGGNLSLDAFVACLFSRSETELKVAYVS